MKRAHTTREYTVGKLFVGAFNSCVLAGVCWLCAVDISPEERVLRQFDLKTKVRS